MSVDFNNPPPITTLPHRVQTTAEFLRVVTQDLEAYSLILRWIFRGHVDGDWRLLPKLDRAFFRIAGEGLVAAHAERGFREDRILSDFKRAARPHLRDLPSDDWEWLALAQHHGLVTRLLDWTRNPLVALYFSVEGVGNGADGAVWAYAHAIPTTDASVGPLDLSEVSYFDPPHISPRIIAQAACFTVHPAEAPAGSSRWPGNLIKIPIAGDAKFKISLELADLGITRASLFPGLDGIAIDLNRGWFPVMKEVKGREDT